MPLEHPSGLLNVGYIRMADGGGQDYATNMALNYSFENVTSGDPDSWAKGSWSLASSGAVHDTYAIAITGTAETPARSIVFALSGVCDLSVAGWVKCSAEPNPGRNDYREIVSNFFDER